jgi:hypothetical protein
MNPDYGIAMGFAIRWEPGLGIPCRLNRSRSAGFDSTFSFGASVDVAGARWRTTAITRPRRVHRLVLLASVSAELSRWSLVVRNDTTGRRCKCVSKLSHHVLLWFPVSGFRIEAGFAFVVGTAHPTKTTELKSL